MKLSQRVVLDITWDSDCSCEEPCECEITFPENWNYEHMYDVAANAGVFVEREDYSIRISTFSTSPVTEES